MREGVVGRRPYNGGMSSEWTTPEHALAYLQMADRIPHRTEGEATLLEEVPREARRVLDLGSGDGRLLALLLLACPAAGGVAVEFSPLMLERLRQRFSQAMVRSTIQRFGNTTNLPASERLTISTLILPKTLQIPA